MCLPNGQEKAQGVLHLFLHSSSSLFLFLTEPRRAEVLGFFNIFADNWDETREAHHPLGQQHKHWFILSFHSVCVCVWGGGLLGACIKKKVAQSTDQTSARAAGMARRGPFPGNSCFE